MRFDEREAYRLHGRLPAFQRRIAEARRLIEAHPDHAVSVSWGKDSMVLLHLAATIRPDVAVLNIRYPNPNERLADMDRVRDEVLVRPEMAQIRYHEEICPGEWEMYERAGHGFADAMTAEERAAVRWWRSQLGDAAARARAKLRADGVLLGIRQEESNGRRMNVATRGTAYVKMDGSRVALPLARWTGRDVWAWLVEHDLPWLRIYDIAEAGRERARSGFVFATGGAGTLARHGVWTDWWRAYPPEFRAWNHRFPNLHL